MMILAVNVPVFSQEPLRLPEFEPDQEQSQPASKTESRADSPLPLHRDRELRQMGTPGSRSDGGLPTFGTILMALAVVLLLAFGAARMYGTGATGSVKRTASPVDMLFRQNIDGKNAICIVRVGSRLLVLASSSNGLSTLSEITDEVEVESLAIELRAAHEGREGAIGCVARWLERSRRQSEPPRPSRPRPANDPVAGLTVREVEEGRRAG